jgi:hypothetical protein
LLTLNLLHISGAVAAEEVETIPVPAAQAAVVDFQLPQLHATLPMFLHLQ